MLIGCILHILSRLIGHMKKVIPKKTVCHHFRPRLICIPPLGPFLRVRAPYCGRKIQTSLCTLFRKKIIKNKIKIFNSLTFSQVHCGPVPKVNKEHPAWLARQKSPKSGYGDLPKKPWYKL